MKSGNETVVTRAMPRCSAIGCSNSGLEGFAVHRFPVDPKRRLKWAAQVRRAKNGMLWIPPPRSGHVLCEAHFEKDQYESRRDDKRLKRNAIPTIFNHNKPKSKRKLPQDCELQNFSKNVWSFGDHTYSTHDNNQNKYGKVTNCGNQIDPVEENIKENYHSRKEQDLDHGKSSELLNECFTVEEEQISDSKTGNDDIVEKPCTSQKTLQQTFPTNNQENVVQSAYPLYVQWISTLSSLNTDVAAFVIVNNQSQTILQKPYNFPPSANIIPSKSDIVSNNSKEATIGGKELKHQIIETKLHQHIAQLERQNNLLSKHIYSLKKSNRCITENLNELFNEDQKIFLRKKEHADEIDWSKETIGKALEIRLACGSTGYDYLLSLGYPLPSGKMLNHKILALHYP